MSIIKVDKLVKNFTYHKKKKGVGGSIRALFWRQYETKQALKGISFEIKKGEFVGILGPNGAGKSTMMKVLSGIIAPSSGYVEVLGFIPYKKENSFKTQISIVMGQKSQLRFILPALETYSLIQKMYDIPTKVYKERLNYFSNILDVEDLLKIQVRKLSLGQRMKCELIAALLHGPKVLFLDEPTIGIDVISLKKIHEFLKFYNEEFKATILLTSHYMRDVENLCKRLIVIKDGKIGYDGSLQKIIRKYSKKKRVFVLFTKKILKKDLQKIGTVIDYNGYEVELSIPTRDFKSKISLLISKFPVRDISINDVTLDEIVPFLFK